MTTAKKKELMNKAFDTALVTAGVMGLSMASKKVVGEKLTDASSLKDTAKVEVGVAACTLLEKWAQDKKYLPVDPFKIYYIDNG